MAWNERYELSDITFEFSKDFDPSIDPFERLKDIQGSNKFAMFFGQCSTIDDFLQKKGVKIDREPGGAKDDPEGRFERVYATANLRDGASLTYLDVKPKDGEQKTIRLSIKPSNISDLKEILEYLAQVNAALGEGVTTYDLNLPFTRYSRRKLLDIFCWYAEHTSTDGDYGLVVNDKKDRRNNPEKVRAALEQFFDGKYWHTAWQNPKDPENGFEKDKMEFMRMEGAFDPQGETGLYVKTSDRERFVSIVDRLSKK